MGWINKSQWDLWSDGSISYNTGNGKKQVGQNGNGVNPCPYTANYGRGFPNPPEKLPNGTIGPLPGSSGVGTFYTQIETWTFSSARNKAWDAFVSEVRADPASLGVSLAEASQGLNMVTQRATSMYRSYRALRKGDFRKALKELNVGPKRKHRSKVSNRVNQASSLWLEYSFGWKPMVVDIYRGVQAVGQPVPGNDCYGNGSQDYVLVVNSPSSKCEIRTAVRCRQGAFVSVSNPNQYLLQQTGLANPLLIAWELVPFSFVVDWVADVGTSLASVTDLYGCSVSRGYHTYSALNALCKMSKKGSGRWFPYDGRASALRRRAGLSYPMPNFNVRANIGGSLNRAANAVSLLGQILTK